MLKAVTLFDVAVGPATVLLVVLEPVSCKPTSCKVVIILLGVTVGVAVTTVGVVVATVGVVVVDVIIFVGVTSDRPTSCKVSTTLFEAVTLLVAVLLTTVLLKGAA